MEQQNTFELLLNCKPFLIQSKFDRLTKVSSKVYNKLIFNNPHQYIIESDVSENVLRSFINYWINEEMPTITIHNFYEYYSLSQEFGLLTEILEKKKEHFGKDLEFYYGLLKENNLYQSDYEEQIAKNLDEYLDHYGNEMMKLPIHILINIFNHKARQLTDHNLAYNLIQIEFERSDNPKIFALLSYLDGTKLSKENLNDAICSRDLHCNFMPKIDDTCISSALQKQQEMSIQIIDLSQSIKEQRSDIGQIKGQMSYDKQMQETEMNDLKELIKNQSNEISNSEEKNAKQINDIKMLIRDQAIEITSNNEAKDKEIDELKKILAYNSKIIAELKQINSDQANEISACKEAIAELVRNQENDTTRQDVDELKETVKMQAERIEKLESQHSKDIENLKESINENKSNVDTELKKQDDKITNTNSTLKKLFESFNSLAKLISKKSKSSSKPNSSNSQSSSQNSSQSSLFSRSTGSIDSSPEVNTSSRVPKVQIDNSPKLTSSEIYSPRSRHMQVDDRHSQYSKYLSSLNNDQSNKRTDSSNDYRSRLARSNLYGQKEADSPRYAYRTSSNDQSQNHSFYGVPLSSVNDESFLSQPYNSGMNFYSSGMKRSDSSDSDKDSVRSMFGRDDRSGIQSGSNDRSHKTLHRRTGSSKKRVFEDDESD